MSATSIFQKTYKKGSVVFKQGDTGDSAFIIDSGRVEILVEEGNGKTTCVGVLGVGEIFGEMSIMDGSPRSATARALNNCQLSVVNRDQLGQRIEHADPIVRLLISMLFRRVRNNNLLIAAGTLDNDEEVSEVSNLIDMTALEEEVLGHSDPSHELTSIAANSAAIDRIRFESDLLSAVENKEFELHYQPIVNLDDYSLAGMEALVRWNSGTRGFVRPDIFMNIAEESALVVPIGRWVYENACENLRKLTDQKEKSHMIADEFFMSINISGKQFADPQFFNYIEDAPRKRGLDYKRVKLEVTERIFIQGPDVTHWLTKCRNLGLPVVLDDFGTGYSSLNYLTKFDVDQLKIDKSFVDNIHDSNKSFTIAKAVIDMSQGLGINCVSEGIEEEVQLRVLQEMGCALGQGYLFSKPVSFNGMCDLLENWDKIIAGLGLQKQNKLKIAG